MVSFQQTAIAFNECIPACTFNKQIPNFKKGIKDEKWDIFWKDFTTAIYAKDKKRIAELTSKDFYDGGGGTVLEWLDAEVFLNDETFTAFKNILKKGVKDFKGYDGNPYKATGKNKSGDLFFEYKNNQWLFGGIVGD
jgi:hypothetical protein